jgi:hypothetical protein
MCNRGVVRDLSATAVAGTEVSVANVATGPSRTIATLGKGEYGFSALLLGEYEVTVEAAGIRRTILKTPVEAGRDTIASFALGVGCHALKRRSPESRPR